MDQALSDALALIDLGTVPYLIAQPLERRIINLAIYLALLVSDPDTIEAKPSELDAPLVPLLPDSWPRRPPRTARMGPGQTQKPREPAPKRPRPRFSGPQFAINANGGRG